MADQYQVGDRPRAIVHLDLDAFFAAVEVLDDPTLAGKPVVVGGRPQQRGVVAAASYPARKYGVRSAMPMYRAMALCPDMVIMPPRFRRYSEYSRRVMRVLRRASPLVQQVSVDEAYLDLTEQVDAWEGAVAQARDLQAQVWQETGLSASLGLAANKLVAKVASDRDKPGGLTVVRPGEEAVFLAPLPVRVLWGVGAVTAGKLAEMGVTTVGELAQVPEDELRSQFGRNGSAMARYARGIDERPLVTEREAKSVSQERTFARNVTRLDTLQRYLRQMGHQVADRLKRAEMAAGTIAIKLRYADFTTLTRQMSLMVPTDDGEDICRVALVLLERAWERGRAVRLIGVAGRQLSPPPGQLSLW